MNSSISDFRSKEGLKIWPLEIFKVPNKFDLGRPQKSEDTLVLFKEIVLCMLCCDKFKLLFTLL